MRLRFKNFIVATFFVLGLRSSLASILKLFICMLLLITTTVFSASLTKIKVAQDNSIVKLEFTLNQPIKYEVFYLANPSRLVIDLRDTALATTINNSWYANTPIKNIRLGKHEDNRLRVVLDLRNKLAFKYFTNHNNLIIELFLGEKKSKFPAPHFLLASKNTNITNDHVAQPVTQKKEIVTPKELNKSLLAPTNLIKEEENKIADNVNVQTNLTKKSNLVKNMLGDKVVLFGEKFLPPTPIFTQKKIATRDAIIVIDPGHGGKDPGVVGEDQTKEKDVVLAIAKKIQSELNQDQGFKVLLTRDSDYFLALRERLQLAHANKADLFISLHADTYQGSDYKGGVTVFALSQNGATSAAARWLAEKENTSELVDNITQGSVELRSLLVKLAQNESIAASLHAGDSILKRLANVTRLHKHKVEQASFVVLKSPDIPSLLIESGFISDPNEEKQLKDPQYQAKLADAISLGIKDYFITYPVSKK